MPDSEIELQIEKLSFGGDGVARRDGLVYFVPFSAPGDLVRAKVTEKKKNFARAEVIEILSPSPFRKKAPCPYFGRCGGCTWQHITDQEQQNQKQLMVGDQLNRVLTAETEIYPLIPSPLSFRYRNRIQLKFDGQNLGFYARQSHRIVDIDDCPITEEKIAQEILPTKQDLLERNSSSFAKIELLLTENGKVEKVFEDSPYEGVGFSQVNSRQNENLIATVLDWMTPFTTSRIYDLYAGGGNFTFPLMKRFPQCSFISVELSSKSVEQAQMKIRQLGLSPRKSQFFLSDVEAFLKRNTLKDQCLVLLDPPRGGCSENVVRSLAVQKQIQRIFYVSCNPASLARDLERFQTFGGWFPTRIQPFDMFPQTDHVETLVELKQGLK